MRIAFIGQKGVPAKSGTIEKHVERLATRMAKEGHEVFVYVRPHYTDPKLKAWKGVHLIHLPSLHSKNLDAISHTILSTVHALFSGYDIIHYHGIGPSSLLFIPKMLLRKVRIVSTFHCQDYFHKKWSWFARMYLRFGEYITCRIPDRTIVVSRELQQYVRRRYRRLAEFVPNGAEAGRTENSSFLPTVGLREKRYVLSVGRLVGYKGVHYLIKAFLELEDTNSLPNNTKLVIVGASAATPEYEKYLRLMAKGRENILFLGERFNMELEQLFSHAAVFVQPSEAEGASLALLEALGHGVPTIASNIRANADILGNAGLLFENKKVADLREKLAYLLNRPEDAAVFGDRGERLIRSKYSWDALADRTLSIYGEIISARGRNRNVKRLAYKVGNTNV